MAGESPDRSKQRESSAEPTSGSAGPVPGARSESADPRLAVARDAKSSKTSSAGRGGVDTATRVLSVPTDGDAKAAPAEAERADADPDATDVTASDVTASGEEAGGDAGTRDAERAEGDSEADAEPGDTEGDGAGDEGAASAEGSGEQGDDAGSAGPDADAPAGDGRLREAVAAWVATADQDGEPDRSTGDDAEPGTADRGTGSDGEPEADRSAGTSTESPADASERPAATRDAASDATDADATTGKPAKPGTGDEPERPAARTDTADATDATDAGDTGKGRDGGKSAAPYADQPTAVFRTDGKPAAATAGNAASNGTDADATTGKPAKPGTGDEPERPAARTDAADATDAADTGKGRDGGKSAAPYADQPTAVFKAVRPPVDQATTMLKLGDAAKDAPRSDRKAAPGDARKGTPGTPPTDARKGTPGTAPEDTRKGTADATPEDSPKGAAGGAAEKDAERTSKFVALKPLDDPATRKPPSAPKADAAAAAGATAAPEQKAPAAPAKDVPVGRTSPAEATAAVPVVGPERTTQQPLPPKPPLDLLAELTNTPPPPETPLRTAVRRVKIWTPIALLLVVVFAVVQSVRPLPSPTLDLTAKDSYTFEGGKVDIPWPADGQAALDVQGIGTFGSSGEQRPVPIASVAKVMTAYVILRDHPLKSGEDGPKIGIDQAAEDQSDAGQESTVDVTKGDKISQREALEGILIASANNVARLLARWDAGSEKAFVRKMNDAAEDLGMKNSTYTDPSGLNNTTVSTAVDQVKLAKAAMQQPAFREVAAMMSYVDYKGVKHDNWNRLVGYNDVTGIKTGTTTSALGNLVFSAKKDVNGETRRIIGAVVRQPAGGPDNTILGAALHEGDKLIRAAQGALESATILKKGEVVGYADDGLGGRTPVVVTKDVTAVGWAGLSVKLTFAADELPHQAKAGTKVGTLTVGDGSSSAVKVPVALERDLVEPGFADKLTRIG
ncbi:D-alanyl-D-alanine carboxypeptidase [Streptomyces djakartensis]|uniref:D-alanyl-D-alanine carboxypeptidase n=1 Tax=Streptomyces djakartensis TaxID=68193 RepID=UPI0034DFADC1